MSRDEKLTMGKKLNRSEKYRKFYERQRELHKLIKENGSDILHSVNFKNSKNFVQHGTMSVHSHSRNVAKYSLIISRKLGIQCNQKDLVRGALLHDYFLYDWHDKKRENYNPLHGFYHPGIALKNAEKEYKLTPRQKDIIGKHMWPLTVVPPKCREAWIVSMADKYCSLMETIRLHKGHNRRQNRRRK